jgi:hypothetical protein
MGYLGGVPYALKVFYDEKYDHYKTYKAGHYKTVRENKDLFKKDWFQELCLFFQSSNVDPRIVEGRIRLQEHLYANSTDTDAMIELVKNGTMKCKDFKNLPITLESPFFNDLKKNEDPDGRVDDLIRSCSRPNSSTVNSSTVNSSTVNSSTVNSSTVNSSTANSSTVNSSTANSY